MDVALTAKVIKSLCGQLAYEKGEALWRSGKVSVTHYDPIGMKYEASVIADRKSRYDVTASFDTGGNISAECACPRLSSYDKYCKHIAASLLAVHRLQQEFAGNRQEDAKLTRGMLRLFGERTIRTSPSRVVPEARSLLEVEVICRLLPYGYRKHMFGVELKIGPKRLYIVQQIRDFLERVDRGEAYALTKQFTYDPVLHYFQKENDDLLRQCIRLYRNEQMYRESARTFSTAAAPVGGERILLIPPYGWDSLLPLLLQAPSVRLELGEAFYDKLEAAEGPLPLRFAFDTAGSRSYRLEVDGLERMVVLDAYGAVLAGGKLLKVPHEEAKRLAELKLMLEGAEGRQVTISRDEMEPFMEKVVPGLMKLGSVHLSEAVSERMSKYPLKARLYLDRVRDRLLAGLEFQYGDVIINPLAGGGRDRKSTERILVRDGEQERRILELMEQSAFVRTEEGYFLDEEDGEYEFLYRIVPELEKLVTIYATSSVKPRLAAGPIAPKITVEVDERTDWLDFRFDIAGIPEAEIRKVLQSLSEKRKYHRMPGGAFVPLESEAFQEIVRFINEIGIRINDLPGTQFRLPAAQAARLLDSPSHGHAVRLGKSLRRLLEHIRNPDDLEFPVPASLSPVLRDYQKYGFGWLKTLAHYHFGGILADDMGLGKTVQSIAFLVSSLADIREMQLPALIVCPASLMYNWQQEIARFAPELKAEIVDGSRSERSQTLKRLTEADVLITSYPLLRRDVLLYAQYAFHTLILDEAQAFKNHATQTAQAVKTLQARHRFALTGTPIENRLDELWSIFHVVFPELFPGRQAFGELTREAVARRARPFLLRRLKSDVLKELPEKIETLHPSELLPEQKKLYAAYLAELRQETLKHLNADSFNKNRIKILAGLTRLRQLCCHPALFVEDYAGGSAKFEQLLEIIEECRGAGKRMLVFSQFTEMLGLISRELSDQGIPYFYLDGHTPAADRVAQCTRFNEGERDVFLVSLKAGGTGLNLTGADTVILYDLWWNPAVEQQAADRAYRIGQKKVVQVIRLLAQGTIEDKIYELQHKKKHLIDEVLQPGETATSALSEQDIRDILMI
ncbi:ATP-dependent helicase HepA [Paenibacillus konkukensis]|uniref:ATP-dependent helicase HepA n=1 Tax=Paenibacillus konkukensis TaxID=2020716 RepID=A0ABY4REI0_9BACL|nr:DEAD/DEAH box helicase [Paenibacillus konkukensis]UQZ80967.1 ATP-dependent helicase HepA [Paenibacillus konkukensis]